MKLKTATIRNYVFLVKMLSVLEIDIESLSNTNISFHNKLYYLRYRRNVIETREILKDLINDWSSKYTIERKSYIDIIINDIKKNIKNPVNVLVTNNGAGRLLYEVAKQGFIVHAIDNKLVKCIVLNFVFNKFDKLEEHEIQPFIYSFSNLQQESNPFEIYKVPNEILNSDTTSNIFLNYCKSLLEIQIYGN